MKISLLITSFGQTGVEVTMVRLANGMLHAGNAVDLVVMSDNGTSFRSLLDPSIRIVDLKSPRLWTCLPALVRYIKRERPDAMIAAAPLANGLAGLAKRLSGTSTPVILTEHGLRLFGFADEGSFRRRLLRYALQRGYREADALVGVSEGIAVELRKLPSIPRDRVHVIYNPVWSPELQHAAQGNVDHPWFGTSQKLPVVVSAGRLAKEKDFDTLLRAIAIARQQLPMRLLVLGEGEEKAALLDLIEELELKDCVQLMGFVERPLRYMAQAQTLVLSSIHEGFGNVIVEAMACGVPIVSTDCPTGPREILQDGRYGTLVPVGDAGALADGIILTLSKTPDRRVLIERAKHFSVENAVENYLKLIGSLSAR